MHPRFRLIWWCLVAACFPWAPARGQDLQNFTYADSLTLALFYRGEWRALDSVGRAALRVGTDYPVLRLRLGYAAAVRDQPALALRHYGRALRANPADSLARHGLVLAHLALNQRELAVLNARQLSDSLRRQLHLRSFYAVQRVEAEVTGQTTTTITRDDAGVALLGVGSQLRPWLYLMQYGTRYGQSVRLPEVRAGRTYAIRQWEYQGLLTAAFRTRWQVKAGYHFLHSQFATRTFRSHLFYGAVAYARPFYTVQAGAYAGTVTDTSRLQIDLRATVYPLANQRLYLFERASLVRSGGKNYPNALLGVGSRVRRWLWLEAFGTTGRVPLLAEADGTYVYNLLDPLRKRGGVGGYFAIGKHLTARLHYVAEQRRRAYTKRATYRLYALTTGLQWNW